MDIDVFLTNTVGKSTQHKRFYHFTDRKNLDSIRSHGLLCTRSLRAKKLFDGTITGGDANSLESDAAKGTDKYVCLCFTDSHPMAFIARTERNLDPVYLQVDPQVLKLPGVMITDAPSNQNGVERIPAAKALDSLDLEVLYTRMVWSVPEINARLRVAEKYEILVPRGLATKYILAGL
jgi:hypothetical protein